MSCSCRFYSQVHDPFWANFYEMWNLVEGLFLCSSMSGWSIPFKKAVFSPSEVPLSSIGVGLFWVHLHCVCPSVPPPHILTRAGISKVWKKGSLILTLFFFKIRCIIILPISIKSLAMMIEELDQFGENRSFYLLCCHPSHEHGMSVDLNLLISFISIMYLPRTHFHLPRSRGSLDES